MGCEADRGRLTMGCARLLPRALSDPHTLDAVCENNFLVLEEMN